MRSVAAPIVFLALTILCPQIIHAKSVDSISHAVFPMSCTQDFSSTLDAPAGKHGFLTTGSDGHFHWRSGERVKFWGINVSSTRLNIPNEMIEEVVSNFAKAGLNLVRLEAIDNRNCLLGSVSSPDSRHLDSKYLDRLNYWMDCLRRHGIYYYLDLLDFRTFKDGDGVVQADALDRGARPYAVFDKYLIQLQKEYAFQLLTEQNPYSNLSPLEDPALAMVEICNEHGFFLYPDKLEALAEPYHTDLKYRWNRWLTERYGSRENLDTAWGVDNDLLVLRPEEDPALINVSLPLLSRSVNRSAASTALETRRSIKRQRDGVLFLYTLQRQYFAKMKEYLRAIGLKIPITAVVSGDIIPDVASAAAECDFTAENWYGDGPNPNPQFPGVNFYSNRNPLRDDSSGGFAPAGAALRWKNRPVVLREWCVSWPNRWRSAAVPQCLAYSSLQDFDALLLFGYQTNRALNGANSDRLNDYACQQDTTVWGQFALAGQVFLRSVIKPAEHSMSLKWSGDNLFTWPNTLSSLYRAAWAVRVENYFASSSSKLSDPKREKIVKPGGSGADLNSLRSMLTIAGTKKQPLTGISLAKGEWKSDTGQITLNSKEGIILVHTPTLSMIAGELVPNRVYDLGGGVRFSTPSAFGSLMILALDGKSISKSKRLVVKMVSLAENTGQNLDNTHLGSLSDWALRSPGSAPVITFGRQSIQPVRLWIANLPESEVSPIKPINRLRVSRRGRVDRSAAHALVKPNMRALTPPTFTLFQENGSWELSLQNGSAALTTDTLNVNGIALGQNFTTSTIGTINLKSAEGTARLPRLPHISSSAPGLNGLTD